MAGAGLLPPGTPPPKLSDQEILELIFFPVVNEGCRVVAEGIVDKPADLDVCSVLAMGFPPYRCAAAWAARRVGQGKAAGGGAGGPGQAAVSVELLARAGAAVW
jgi:enoyl-CoA hydratase/3-hydroxyacyl-CoA dehydrogenase